MIPHLAAVIIYVPSNYVPVISIIALLHFLTLPFCFPFLPQVEARVALRNEGCAICLMPTPTISTLCCGLALHVNCLNKWRRKRHQQQSQSCPNCRQGIEVRRYHILSTHPTNTRYQYTPQHTNITHSFTFYHPPFPSPVFSIVYG